MNGCQTSHNTPVLLDACTLMFNEDDGHKKHHWCCNACAFPPDTNTCLLCKMQTSVEQLNFHCEETRFGDLTRPDQRFNELE